MVRDPRIREASSRCTDLSNRDNGPQASGRRGRGSRAARTRRSTTRPRGGPSGVRAPGEANTSEGPRLISRGSGLRGEAAREASGEATEVAEQTAPTTEEVPTSGVGEEEAPTTEEEEHTVQ